MAVWKMVVLLLLFFLMCHEADLRLKVGTTQISAQTLSSCSDLCSIKMHVFLSSHSGCWLHVQLKPLLGMLEAQSCLLSFPCTCGPAVPLCSGISVSSHPVAARPRSNPFAIWNASNWPRISVEGAYFLYHGGGWATALHSASLPPSHFHKS